MKQFLQNTSILLAATAFFLISSCDVIEDPVVPIEGYNSVVYGEAPTFDPIASSTKGVLVEDFTAHQCGNCPPAAEIAEQLASDNPETVFPVAIHAGSLSATSDDYPTDWTCEEGEELFLQLSFQLNPAIRVNRTGGVANFLNTSSFAEAVANELTESAPMGLQIATNWHPDASHLNIHVNGQWLEGGSGDYKLAIYILESHLHGDQLYYGNDPEHIYDYEFNHLLRGTLTGATGLVACTDPEEGTSFQSDFTYNWNNEWLIENSSIVALVTDEDGYVVNCLGQYIIE